MLRNSLLLLLLIISGLLWIAAFPPFNLNAPVIPQWNIADVRVLDPADTPPGTTDALAMYWRISGETLDLRLDFLDNAPLPDYDLWIALDTTPGGTRRLPGGLNADLAWETLLIIPAQEPLRVLDAELHTLRGVGMRIIRNSALDQLTIRVGGLSGLNQAVNAQALLLSPGSFTVMDRLAPTSTALRPLHPAPVGMIFTNVFPAYSPAQSLRRWSGAHTGPLGGSHGLAHLLRAAQEAQIPLALYGLTRPEALSALDTVHGVELARAMQQQRLLTLLPDPVETMPGPPASRTADFGLQMLRQENDNAGASVSFGQAWYDLQPIDRNGPTPALNRALIAEALATNHNPASPPLLLGGELPSSAWGAANYARFAFHYLASRPWVRFLTTAELSELQRPGQPPEMSSRFAPDFSPGEQAGLLTALHTAPANALSVAARQAYGSLFAPVYPAPQQLPELRRGYAGVVWSLLHASVWAENPQPRLDCGSDPDHDGRAECLLADERRYAQLEVESGILSYLFTLDAQGAHQWVAPSAQFITGTGNPLMWDIHRGLLADMAVIPGALYDTAALPGEPMQARIENGDILLFKDDLPFQKRFILQPGGLRIEIPTDKVVYPRIPLSLAPDPWLRFIPGWAQQYTWERSDDSQTVSITAPGAATSVTVRSNCAMQISAFNDALQWLDRPENPDREYPRGHYLPFPMFLIECTPGTQSTLIFEIGE